MTKLAKTWTPTRAASEYVHRTARQPADDARLGWALAVRAYLHHQAIRGFANVGRARRVAVEPDEPAWVREGLVTLRDAFEVYAVVDPGWGLLLRWPTIASDLGVFEESPLDPELREMARVAVARANAELDVSRGARAKDADARAFFTGLSMRRPQVTPAELQLLAIAIGLEPATTSLDPGRRRWADRAKRWALHPDDRERLVLLSAVDVLLDAPENALGELVAFARGGSHRSDSASGGRNP